MVGYSSCLSLRFTFLLSVSLTASYSAASRSSPSPSLSLNSSPPPPSKATPSDLLSLLGPSYHSRLVDPLVAKDIRSCFRFLVPFTPAPFNSSCAQSEDENQLLWWPPEPVLELARLAFDSGANPDVVHRAIDPSIIPVPDVENTKEDRCELTRTPYGRRFISEELNLYLEFLFELIVARGPSIGLEVSLNRYDFFHGHLFITADTRRLGILFHAKEFPAYDKEFFPYNMGYCQKGSYLKYDDSMNLRNILWLAPLPSDSPKSWAAPGVLVVLDARPGGIIFRDLIPDYVSVARTIYEDDLGTVAVDVNYLNVGCAVPDYQIFIC